MVPVVSPFQSLQYCSVVTDRAVVLSLGRVRHLWPGGSGSEWPQMYICCSFFRYAEEALLLSTVARVQPV